MPSQLRELLAVALGVLLVMLVSAGDRARADQQGISFGTLERILAAKMLYQENCAACHGYDGVPLLPDAANFAEGEKLDKPDSELLGIINLGGEDMPPWEDILTDLEQHEVLSYVRVLPGDKIYQERCLACHEAEAPRIEAAAGAGEFCPGSDVETGMTKRNFAEVTKFLSQINN
ncbi:MAG: cytochrome c [Alphaproteobacteria bacterium]|nr:cytochrome c [Alphaproteobacteria bacterium]